jgi:hypothetical protein
VKTAVDQLIEKMSLEDVCKYSNELAEAKLMEKEQTVKGILDNRNITSQVTYRDAVEYFDKTFKQPEP